LDSNRCACDVHSSTNWPISTFFMEKDEPTYRCNGGDHAGYLCTPASLKAKDTCRGGICRRAFSRQFSAAVSSRYGCYFLHHGSQAPVKPEYHACGTTTARNSGGQEDETELKYQKAVDVCKLTPSTPFCSRCRCNRAPCFMTSSTCTTCQVHMHGFTQRSMLLMIFLVKVGFCHVLLPMRRFGLAIYREFKGR
jgi:hypothetical protein